MKAILILMLAPAIFRGLTYWHQEFKALQKRKAH